MTDEGIIEDAKDMAENERYMQDKMDKTLQTAPFINQMAVGGEPGQFSDSMITGMEEDINVDDIINQPGFESMSDFDIFEEAKKQKKSINEHFAHMVIHGILHLQGYDHITDTEKNVMEKKEIAILDRLGYRNPYVIDNQ